jgi:hypothetical protein
MPEEMGWDRLTIEVEQVERCTGQGDGGSHGAGVDKTVIFRGAVG